MNEKKEPKTTNLKDIANQLQTSIKNVGTLPKEAVKITEKLNENTNRRSKISEQ